MTIEGHHAVAGGALQHTIAVATICREVAQLQPRLDESVLAAAALTFAVGAADAFPPGRRSGSARRAGCSASRTSRCDASSARRTACARRASASCRSCTASPAGGRGRPRPPALQAARARRGRRKSRSRARPVDCRRCCGSRSPRSTSRSATSRRTAPASRRPAPRPRAGTPTSCWRRSSRSRAIRRRTSSCARASSPRAAARSTPSRREIEVPLLVGTPWLDGDRVRNAAALLAGGAGRRALREAGAAELRRLRRAADVRAGPAQLVARRRRRALRDDDLRGHLAARRPGAPCGARRRARDPEPVVVALPRRQGRRARGDAAHPRPRRPRLRRLLQPRRRPGRAALRRRERRDRARTAACSPGRRRSRRTCCSSTSTSARRSRRACATRGRAATSSRSPPTRRCRRAGPRARRSRRAPAPPPASVEAELWAALRVGLRDYVQKNGFRRVADRALRRHRLGAGRGARRRRPRARPCRVRLDADAFNVAETRSDARLVAERLGVGFRELPIEDLRDGVRRARCRTRAASRPRTCRRGSAACS